MTEDDVTQLYIPVLKVLVKYVYSTYSWSTNRSSSGNTRIVISIGFTYPSLTATHIVSLGKLVTKKLSFLLFSTTGSNSTKNDRLMTTGSNSTNLIFVEFDKKKFVIQIQMTNLTIFFKFKIPVL